MTKKLSIPLISDVPPDSAYTAGQVLDRIMSSMPDVQFEFYWVNHSHLPPTFAMPDNSIIARVFGFELRGRWLRFSQFVGRLGLRWQFMHRIAVMVRVAMWAGKSLLVGYRLGRALRSSPSKVIWCVVQGEKTIICYTIAAKISKKKIVLHQWDPLSWWMTHRGYPARIYGPIKTLLNRLESRAVLNVVPSDAWKETMLQEGKRCMRLDNFFDNISSSQVSPVFLKDSSNVHAVFIGQLYSNLELDRLLSTLCQALHLRNHRLTVHYFGAGSPVLSNKGYRLIAHGVLPRDELIQRISKWDVALLPYPTEQRFEEASSLSFPSKSRVYLAAGLPILAWTVNESSPDRFYKKHYSMHYCNAMQNHDVLSFVDQILNCSAEQRAARYAYARRIVDEQFSFSSELVPFANFMTEEA